MLSSFEDGARPIVLLTVEVDVVYAAYVGGCGSLAMWGADGERVIRQLTLKTRLTIDLTSPAAVETPLGRLLLKEDGNESLRGSSKL